MLAAQLLAHVNPTRRPMKFQSIDLSQIGPFAANQSVSFEPDLTLIEGGNGCGKTTIAEALRREFIANFHWNSVDIRLAESLVFIGSGIGASPSLKRLVDCLLAKVRAEELTALAKSISNNLINLVPDKRQSVSGRPYIAELSVVDGLRIVDESRSDCRWRFAASENFALALATNLAAREILKLEVPIVADAPFDAVGQPQLFRCAEAILSMSVQRVVICHEYFFQQMGLLPHYRLQAESRDNGLIFVVPAQ